MAISAAQSARFLRIQLGVFSVLAALGGRLAWAGEAPAPEPRVGVATDPAPAELGGGQEEVDVTPPEVVDEPGTQVDEMAAKAAEEKRLRRERAVAFARRRVREMAERKVRAEARAQRQEEAKRRAASPAAVRVPTPVPPRAELPTIVDHRSALERQLAAGWGWGADKDRQVRVPLPDWQNWRRVRLFGIDHLAAFTYTKQHHTLTAVFAVETRAKRPSSLSCMEEFERRGMPEIRRHGVQLEPVTQSASSWDQRPVLVHKTEGRVSVLFSRYEFSAAWTAYPAYDYGCLVYATVVLWDGQPDLARKLLDRFVSEGVGQVRPLTAVLPARQPGTSDSARRSERASSERASSEPATSGAGRARSL